MLEVLFVTLLVIVLLILKPTRNLIGTIWIFLQGVLLRVFKPRNFILVIVPVLLIFATLWFTADSTIGAIYRWGGWWGILTSSAILYILFKAKKLWFIATPIVIVALIKLLCPTAFDGLLKNINDLSKKSNLLSTASHSQDITKTGVRAIIKDKSTLVLENGSKEMLSSGTKMLVNPEKTRQRENSEEEVWITLPNSEGVFLEGKSGWLPVSRLIYTNGELIDKMQLITKIHFVPNTWSEVNFGKQKIDLPPGNYEINSVTGGYKQRFLNMTTKEEEYFSIGKNGIYHDIKEVRDHLPLPEVNFGTPIIFVGDNVYPLKNGSLITVKPEDKIFVSVNTLQEWSHIGTDSSMSFVKNKGQGFTIELTLKP